MDTINYTEEELKQIGLLKAWIKLSKVGGNFGKKASKTFSKDWIKLQEDFVDRLGLEGGRVYINKTMNLIEDYIKADEVEEVECVECSTIVPSSEAELTGTEGWGICDRCGDEEEELDAWCYRCDKFFSADTEQGGDDGTEEEEWVCNSCFKK